SSGPCGSQARAYRRKTRARHPGREHKSSRVKASESWKQVSSPAGRNTSRILRFSIRLRQPESKSECKTVRHFEQPPGTTVSDHAPHLAPVLHGRATSQRAESRTERPEARVAEVHTDIRHARMIAGEHALRLIQPHTRQKLMRSLAERGREQPVEMER